MEYLRSSSRRTLPASRRKGTSSLPSGRASSPPEVKLPEGSRRKPKEAKDALPSGGSEGRPSFGRKPPEVKLPEGRSEKSCFLREPLALPSESARGEAFRRKPKVQVHVLREANLYPSFGKLGLMNLFRFLRKDGLVSERMPKDL